MTADTIRNRSYVVNLPQQGTVHLQVSCGYQTKWRSFPHVLQTPVLVQKKEDFCLQIGHDTLNILDSKVYGPLPPLNFVFN